MSGHRLPQPLRHLVKTNLSAAVSHTDSFAAFVLGKIVSVQASNKSAANSAVKPSAPEGAARMVLAVPDEPARGRKPVLRDELAVVATIHRIPPERLRKILEISRISLRFFLWARSLSYTVNKPDLGKLIGARYPQVPIENPLRISNLFIPKALPLLFVLSWAMTGCLDPVVGAECEEGLEFCNGQCISFDTYENCGSCGFHCGPYLCVNGRCDTTQRRSDAGFDFPKDTGIDGEVDSGADVVEVDAGDAAPVDVPDTSLPLDVGLTESCPLGQMKCDGECVPSSVEHCGSCDNACEPEQFCAGNHCVDDCEDWETRCGNLCVDLMWDPNHCGGCNNRCISGICAAGKCADATAGHLVVIGHNFTNATVVMQRLAGNAVFLSVGAPVRVLVFEGDALSESIEGTDRAIEYVASETGREWQREIAIDGLVTLQLATADVFVIYAQQNARNNELEKYGESWGVALSGFLRQGGVVVLFDGTGDNQGTFQILKPAQIFEAEELLEVRNGTTLSVIDLSDQIALNVPQLYVSRGDTVGYESISTPGNVVVTDSDEVPIIIHRVIFN